MSIYKEERPWEDGRQITFTDSNHFIIEAMAPGDDIFDETGEIPALRGPGEAVQKKCTLWLSIFPDLQFAYTSSLTGLMCRLVQPFLLKIRTKRAKHGILEGFGGQVASPNRLKF